MLLSRYKLRKDVKKMKVSKKKVEIALATNCMNPYELCKKAEIQQQTYRRMISDGDCKPATVGKIAKALNVKVEDLVE